MVSPNQSRWPLFLILLGAIAAFLLLSLSLLVGGLLGNHLPWSDPPGLGARLATYFQTNVAETRPDSPFPELQTRSYDLAPEVLFDQVHQAVERLGWDMTQVQPEHWTIQAIVTSRLWHFKDDVTLRVQPEAPNRSSLYLLSASRIGEGDLGTNSRHILDLYQALRAVQAQT